MNKNYLWLALLLVVLVTIVLARQVFSKERAYRVSDGKIISFSEMIREIKGSQVVFFGEIHDRQLHHEEELRVIKALRRSGAKVAVGLEMFDEQSQKGLDEWVSGNMRKADFIRLYYRNWAMPWPLYGRILVYARRQKIPLIGLNAPASIAEKVAAGGFASLSSEEKRSLPPDITCNVSPAYMAFIRSAYAEHADPRSFVHFCEAQMLWNKTMAWNVARFLEKNPGWLVVVLTGSGHALKRGMPEELKERLDVGYKVILPETPDLPLEKATTKDADYILLHGRLSADSG